MHVDSVHALASLTARAASTRTALQALQVECDLTRTELERTRELVQGLTRRAEVLVLASHVVKTIQEQLLDQPLGRVKSVLGAALNTVFPEHHLRVDAEMVLRYGKTHIDLTFTQSKYGITGKPTSQFGGGPAVLASLVLRMLVLLRNHQLPFLVLDESLSAVSPWHIPACAAFLTQLCREMGVDVLLVTQQTEFSRIVPTLSGTLVQTDHLPALRVEELHT